MAPRGSKRRLALIWGLLALAATASSLLYLLAAAPTVQTDLALPASRQLIRPALRLAQEERAEAQGSPGGEGGSRIQPAASLLCTDSDDSVTCRDALRRGLCFGGKLFKCMRSCGTCDMMRTLVEGALQLNGSRIVHVSVVSSLSCTDRHDATGQRCAKFVHDGGCRSQSTIGLTNCKASCGFCQPPQRPIGVAAAAKGAASSAGSGTGSCIDHVDVCAYLASSLQACDAQEHSAWMVRLCPASCDRCDPHLARAGRVTPQGVLRIRRPGFLQMERLEVIDEGLPCADYSAECGDWATAGQCLYNSPFMHAHCQRSCGLCGKWTAAQPPWLVGTDRWGRPRIASVAVAHLPPFVPALRTTSGDDPHNCQDDRADCVGWASYGECDRNPVYMRAHCSKSCGVCSGVVHSLPAFKGRLAASQADQFIEYLPGPAITMVRLNNGVLMPAVGFGTAGLGEGTGAAVRAALVAGYRHLDSAQGREWYREDLAGMAWREVAAERHMPRRSVFLTTKIHPRHLGKAPTLAAFKQSLADFNTDHMDLVLLHYPQCWGTLCAPQEQPYGQWPHLAEADQAASATPADMRTWQESWRALEGLYDANQTRAIGVSNFNADELRKLYDWAQVKPQVVQVHMDPFSQAADVREFCRGHGIQVVAYSSLGTQWAQGPRAWDLSSNPVFNSVELQAVAADEGRSVAQVTLRWALHMGALVIPRSTQLPHMEESLRVLSFSLSEESIKSVLRLDGTVVKG